MNFIDNVINGRCNRFVRKWIRESQLPIENGTRFRWIFLVEEKKLKIVYNSMIRYVDYEELMRAC